MDKPTTVQQGTLNSNKHNHKKESNDTVLLSIFIIVVLHFSFYELSDGNVPCGMNKVLLN